MILQTKPHISSSAIATTILQIKSDISPFNLQHKVSNYDTCLLDTLFSFHHY
uniref:Uncharacterized protein n=1 Tax=Rhizophora mucronata TaxID=61149 RepID=A0A2P2N0R4_RHIMU